MEKESNDNNSNIPSYFNAHVYTYRKKIIIGQPHVLLIFVIAATCRYLSLLESVHNLCAANSARLH